MLFVKGAVSNRAFSISYNLSCHLGMTGLLHFDENRHAVKNPVINTVKDGKTQFHQFIFP